MVTKDKLTTEKDKTVSSETNSTEKKQRPQHSQCHFAQDGRCTNKASLFYGEVRELDALVCSTFRRRDA